MKILVDTSVWSVTLRRQVKKKDQSLSEISERLKNLIEENRAVLIGPIKQELLSGLTSELKFLQLKKLLAPFDEYPVESQDYISAADLSNQCRRKGIQGSPIDFLICAVAIRYHLKIFTLDKDFTHYQRIIDIELFK